MVDSFKVGCSYSNQFKKIEVVEIKTPLGPITMYNIIGTNQLDFVSKLNPSEWVRFLSEKEILILKVLGFSEEKYGLHGWDSELNIYIKYSGQSWSRKTGGSEKLPAENSKLYRLYKEIRSNNDLFQKIFKNGKNKK